MMPDPYIDLVRHGSVQAFIIQALVNGEWSHNHDALGIEWHTNLWPTEEAAWTGCNQLTASGLDLFSDRSKLRVIEVRLGNV